MTTPIADFVRDYAQKKVSRFHMPGHKGRPFLGCEAWDITEVQGADVLYAPDGIIAESEANATALFGTARTFYSTEGSSLAIKAMLALVTRTQGERAWILAARNVHKSFLYAAALLDFCVSWLEGSAEDHLCRCTVTPSDVEKGLVSCPRLPSAVYVTSPDYLGNVADLAGIAEVCRRYGVPLLVDNAHGAYLRFLEPNRHPIAMGAAMCCDSAHKTLPVLTGGAYLHVAKGYEAYAETAEHMLALFASTSPSYLILQSLDLCNRYLSEGYRERLAQCVRKVNEVKEQLRICGLKAEESEPLKLVFCPARLGFTGFELAEHFRSYGIEAEFYDETHVVLMATPELDETDWNRLISAAAHLTPRSPISIFPARKSCKQTTSGQIRRAMFAVRERLAVTEAAGRICAEAAVCCPPAVPIVLCGERIDESDIVLLRRYGIEFVDVVKE